MDKFECGLRLVLVVLFVLGAILIAPAAGRMATAAGLRQVRRESTWRQVSATLMRPPPARYYGYGSMATYWVPGRWRAPSGAIRQGMIPVRSGLASGRRVSLWVNQSGSLTGRHPMTTGMVGLRSAFIEIGSVVGLAVVLLALAGLAAIMLNRRRLFTWGIDWACFGPRWSTRRWPRS